MTKLSAMLYRTVMRHSEAEDALGLPVNIFGSGYAVKMKWRDLVKQVDTLVTDFEFSCLLLLNGARSVSAPRAVFYADMPTSLAEALSQRRRWAMGDTQCYRKYRKRMRKAVFTHGIRGFKQYMDLIMNPFVSFSAVGLLLLIGEALLYGIPPAMAISVAAGLLLFYAVFEMMLLKALKEENMPIKGNGKASLLFPFWVFLSAVFAVETAFRKSVKWNSTPRNSTASIEELEQKAP